MAHDASKNEDVMIINFGTLIGGSGANSRRWEEAIWGLSRRIDCVARDLKASLKLNVVFHIPGNMLKPEFSGVRTSTYFRKLAVLMIQVALPEERAEDERSYIKQVTHLAIDEAAHWALKRRLEFDVGLFHDIVERAEEVNGDPQ